MNRSNKLMILLIILIILDLINANYNKLQNEN